MNSGDFRGDKNQVKSLGEYDSGLYLSLFGGDGIFDVYGVYDKDGLWPHMPYKLVIHTRDPIDFPKGMELYESTSNYYPGYSDDGTADHMAKVWEKTSPIANKELKKLEKTISNYDSAVDQKFWNKWMYANLIATTLQDGFYLDPSNIKKCIEYYEEVLSDEKIKEYTGDSYKMFKSQVEETLKSIKKQKPIKKDKGKEFYYTPGFMDQRQRKQANTKKDL